MRSFAVRHLEVTDRAAFEHNFMDAGVELILVKDAKLISSKLRRVQHEFERGVKVSQPADLPVSMRRCRRRSRRGSVAVAESTVHNLKIDECAQWSATCNEIMAIRQEYSKVSVFWCDKA